MSQEAGFSASRDHDPAITAVRSGPSHTPGPWHVRGCELIGDSTILATLGWHSGRERENAADCAVIAAAPDLLAACIQVRRANAFAAALGYLEPERWGDELFAAQRTLSAAIAKATGQPPSSQTPAERESSRDEPTQTTGRDQ